MIRDDSVFQAQATLDSLSASADPIQESLKRDIVNQKVRTENRERKKRWRELNEERNKDNDLRCRVNKRANKLLGKEESEYKTRWIEEEFKKRQMKRKDKERRRNPNAPDSIDSPVSTQPTVSLSEQLALHQQHQQQQHQQHQQQLQASHHAASLLSSATAQFDPTNVKTALALNGLVKKSGTHLDLAHLTGVFSDPNLARQLIDIESQHPTTQAPMMLMTPKPEHEMSTGSMIDADYPMDAVLTLMQLNGSWKA